MTLPIYLFLSQSLPHCFKRWLLMCSVAVLGACSVYQPDVTQGNIITAEQVAVLKTGMSRQQVMQILGSPLLQDLFNSNRWDYVYRYARGRDTIEQRVFTVFFDATGKLERWSGAMPPTNKSITLQAPSDAGAESAGAQVTAQPSEVVTKISADVLALNAGSTSVSSSGVANVAASSTTLSDAPPLLTAAVNTLPSPAALSSPLIAPGEAKALRSPDIHALIQLKIAHWRDAWAAKDLQRYSEHYAGDFKGEFANHSAWLAQRQRVFEAADNISITLSDIKVIQTSPTEARAAFNQVYQSSRLRDVGSKNLFFKREGDLWRIVAERFIKLN